MNRQVYQAPRRRGGYKWLGWGCLAIMLGMVAALVVGVIILLPLMPQIAARFAGFDPAGSTDTVFVNPAPIPTIRIQNAVEPPQVFIDAGQYGQFNIDTSQIDVEVGQDVQSGQQVAVATFTETQLLNLCRQRSTLCGSGDPRFRNASIDLRPGGAVINADFFISQMGTWQRAGIVMRLNSQTAQFEVMGVDIDGTLFRVPPGQLADAVREVADKGNDLLRQVVIEAGGATLELREIYADDTTLTMVLR